MLDDESACKLNKVVLLYVIVSETNFYFLLLIC